MASGSVSRVDVELAALHYQADVLQRLDVVGGVDGYRHNVGVLADFDGTDIVAYLPM